MDLLDDGLSASELTERELEILNLAACGLSAKQIAQDVGIAPRTAERHVENVRHKLRARNKTHMITKAVALGILDIDRPTAAQPEANVVALKPRLFGSK